MVKKQSAEMGVVFAVPVGDGRFAVGQVAASYMGQALYLAIFNGIVNNTERETITESLNAPLQFLALSLDAKIHAGHWPVVGKFPVSNSIALPAYSEATAAPDHVDVVDYSGKRRRRATSDEAVRLSNRKIIAPVRLEHAVRARLGLEPWRAAFDELVPQGLTSRDVFEAW